MLGTFASIEKKVLDQGKRVLAYKNYSKSHGPLVFQHYKREIWALKQLAVATKEDSTQHHIVQLVSSQETSISYQLIFPFYNETLMTTMIKMNSSKEPRIARDFLQQISQGLLYMHQHGIIHCDLSPSNILIDGTTGCMFICDFGCAHSSSNSNTNNNDNHKFIPYEEIGTRFYKAPEHLFGSNIYRPATDVWSLGTIFLELLIGYPIFNGESDIEQIGRFVFRLGKPSLQVQSEEMASYPDTNKLIFFGDNDNNASEEYSDEEEDDFTYIRMPLASVLEKEQVLSNDREIVTRILTWSIKDRLTISQLHELLEPCR